MRFCSDFRDVGCCGEVGSLDAPSMAKLWSGITCSPRFAAILGCRFSTLRQQPAWRKRMGIEPIGGGARKPWECTRRRNGGREHEPARPIGAETLQPDGAGD